VEPCHPVHDCGLHQNRRHDRHKRSDCNINICAPCDLLKLSFVSKNADGEVIGTEYEVKTSTYELNEDGTVGQPVSQKVVNTRSTVPRVEIVTTTEIVRNEDGGRTVKVTEVAEDSAGNQIIMSSRETTYDQNGKQIASAVTEYQYQNNVLLSTETKNYFIKP